MIADLKRRAFRRRTGQTTDQVVVGSVWMLASTIAVSIGSFVFWLVATRAASADVVGRSTGLFSAVFFLSYATSLGLPVAVGRYAASDSPLEGLRFRLALATGVTASLVGALLFLAINPGDLLDPLMTYGRPIGWLTLALLAGGVATSVLVDVRLMGLRRWRDVFVRSAAIAVVRLPPLMLAVREETGYWVFVVAAGGYAVTALPYLPALLRMPDSVPFRWADHAEAATYSVVNYLSQLAVQAPLFVTPVVVAMSVSDDDNATFYLSWGVMTVVYLGIHLLGRTLLVEGSKPQADVAKQARTTIILGLGVAIPASLLSIPAAPIVERIYGAEHDDISSMLPLLMLGTIPWVITRTSLAVARATADNKQTIAIAAWSAATVLGGVAIGGIAHDAIAASIGWAVGSFAALTVTGPVLRRQLQAGARP